MVITNTNQILSLDFTTTLGLAGGLALGSLTTEAATAASFAAITSGLALLAQCTRCKFDYPRLTAIVLPILGFGAFGVVKGFELSDAVGKGLLATAVNVLIISLTQMITKDHETVSPMMRAVYTTAIAALAAPLAVIENYGYSLLGICLGGVPTIWFLKQDDD